MASSTGQQLRALIWRHWWTAKRRPLLSIVLYILVPLFLGGLLIAITTLTTTFSRSDENSLKFHNHTSLTLARPFLECVSSSFGQAGCYLGVAPDYSMNLPLTGIPEQMAIFRSFVTKLNQTIFGDGLSIAVFNDPKTMEETFVNVSNSLAFGLVLRSGMFPQFLEYDIRIRSDLVPAPIPSSEPSLFLPSLGHIIGGANDFNDNGFVELQNMADQTLSSVSFELFASNPSQAESSPAKNEINNVQSSKKIDVTENNGIKMVLTLTEWPTYGSVPLIQYTFFAGYIGLILIASLYSVVTTMVTDRISRLKSYLKIMGMTELCFWLSYFLASIVLIVPITFFLGIGFAATGSFGNSYILGVLSLVLLGITSACWIMFVGAIAPSYNGASFLLSIYFLVPFFSAFFANAPTAGKVGMAFIAPINFQWLLLEFTRRSVLEKVGVLREVPHEIAAIPSFNLGVGFGMFIADGLLYAFLAWYFAQIIGGDVEYGGASQPWYFLFTKTYWFPKCGKTINSHNSINNESAPNSVNRESLEYSSTDDEHSRLLPGGTEFRDSDHEPQSYVADDSHPLSTALQKNRAEFENYEDDESRLRIRLRNLKKKYAGSENFAVSGLDMDIYQGIYVLIGENGSGKSTTINMLTGMLEPTSGYANVDGYDVSTNMDDIRTNISICPQHDLLSDLLTGEEHLRMFATLKGIPSELLEERVTLTLKDVGIFDSKDELVSTYSGGMKRSLSLGISLVANSRIIFIDEASSGMDMEKRRSLWDMLILKKKQGTTLILTTHYMEEAEVLGDRIGIMHSGRLVKEGSVEFLKRELGYQITIYPSSKQPISSNSTKSKHLEESSSSSDSSSQEARVEWLPMKQRDKLPSRIKELEESGHQIAVSTPNLEEVFLRVGTTLDVTQSPLQKRRSKYFQDSSSDFVPKNAPARQQLAALLKKRLVMDGRDLFSLLYFVLLPMFILIIGLGITRFQSNTMASLPEMLNSTTADSKPVSTNISSTFPLMIPYSTTAEGNNMDIFEVWKQNISSFLFSTDYIANSSEMARYILRNVSAENVKEAAVIVDTSWGTDSLFPYRLTYNRTEVYSLPRMVNFMNNIACRQYLSNRTSADINYMFIRARSVAFPSHILNRGASLFLVFANLVILLETQFGSIMMFVCCILSAIIARDIVKEKELQLDKQMTRFGLSTWSYWLVHTIVALVKMTIASMVMAATVAAFQLTLMKGSSFVIFFIAQLLAVWSFIPLTFILTRVFSSVSSSQTWIPVIFVGGIAVPSLFGFILNAIGPLITRSLRPPFFAWMARCINFITPFSAFVDNLSRFPTVYLENGYLNWTILLQFNNIGLGFVVQIFHLFLWSSVFALIIHITNYLRLSDDGRLDQDSKGGSLPEKVSVLDGTKASLVTASGINGFPSEDGSMSALLSSGASSLANSPSSSFSSRNVHLSDEESSLRTAVTTIDLWKRYAQATRKAVTPLSLEIPVGMCFGLLGPNGAGKSTTISMLIGDVPPSGGQIFLNSFETIGRSRNELNQIVRLACCLQKNSLFPNMTTKEHIELFLQLRNEFTSEQELKRQTQLIISRMRLSNFADTYASDLSGGNQRKLCTALAALTHNAIIVLDEPSTGCDPGMRRTLWNVIRQEQKEKLILLTTHSMDEADAVCHRIGIMINGSVVSLGTPQSLKAQCGGYELLLWLSPSPEMEASDSEHLTREQIAEQADEVVTAAMQFLVLPAFPYSVLIDRDITHDSTILLHLDVGSLPSLTQAFSILQEWMTQHNIHEYSLSQMTLGAAYQRLVRRQLEDTSSNK